MSFNRTLSIFDSFLTTRLLFFLNYLNRIWNQLKCWMCVNEITTRLAWKVRFFFVYPTPNYFRVCNHLCVFLRWPHVLFMCVLRKKREETIQNSRKIFLTRTKLHNTVVGLKLDIIQSAAIMLCEHVALNRHPHLPDDWGNSAKKKISNYFLWLRLLLLKST